MKTNKYKLPFTGKALIAVDASALRRAGYSVSALISAGYSVSDLRSAGYSVSDLRSAGFSLSDLISLKELIKSIPKLKNPYSQLWREIKEKKRCHQQSQWGPDSPPENICGTPMCTAGHLVNMAGVAGYKLKDATSWSTAATIIHQKAHPDIPHQNFGNIPQDSALAYIKQMAEIEENGIPSSKEIK